MVKEVSLYEDTILFQYNEGGVTVKFKDSEEAASEFERIKNILTQNTVSYEMY
jgi:hypothetical protein